MKPTTFLLGAASPALAEWIRCEETQWAYKGECKEMVGFAAEHMSLPEDAIDFSIGFYIDIQTRGRVYKLNNLLRHDIKNAIALHSMRKENGRRSCLKDVTPQQLEIIKHIANDDYDYDSYGGSFATPRIDYAEMYLENLFHLLFDADCNSRKRLQNRLDKLLKRLHKHCQKQCRRLGYDYFYHNVYDEPLDHFQAYQNIHDEHEIGLGEEIFALNGNWGK